MTTGRLEGRTFNQLRPLALEQGLLNRADGSARYSHGPTSVLAAVYGPTGKPRTELIDKATVEVVFKAKSGISGAKEKEYEDVIRGTLEPVIMTTLHPRTSITIIIQVLADHGSLLSAAINGAAAALLDAGVAMSGMLAAVTFALLDEDGALVMDPDEHEEQKAAGVFLLGYTSRNGVSALVSSRTSGRFSDETFLQAIDAGLQASTAIVNFGKLSIEKTAEMSSR